MVEVDHVEGKVLNILRDVSPTRIDLIEFKRRYDATFVNGFIPEGEGMRYTLTGCVPWFITAFVSSVPPD